ncbi:MAG: stage 0 sporulation protein [Clostridiales bacterium]|nr:stage 0 sporulation protein [Clostridiales bacterium]
MTKVIPVKFPNGTKEYFFDPGALEIKAGDCLLVETALGVQHVIATQNVKEVEEKAIVAPLKSVMRVATPGDLKVIESIKKKEEFAARVFTEEAKTQGYDLNLSYVEYTFDGHRASFYFTSDTRVDFKALASKISVQIKSKVNLNQINAREETKIMGGIGVCGRPFCCSTFLKSSSYVTVKMAREQGLSINEPKISGCCGRLLCCLRYEADTYSHLKEITPPVGTKVSCAQGRGVITDIALIAGRVKVKLDDSPEALPLSLKLSEIKVLK